MKTSEEKKSILVIDDDPEITGLLVDMLQSEGYKGFAAPDGLMGTLKTKNQDFDLIITDLNMPKMNGIKFLQNISRDGQYKKSLPPIIIITGEVTPFAKELCQKLNFPIIEKPFSASSLLEVVKSQLEEASKKAEAAAAKTTIKKVPTSSNAQSLELVKLTPQEILYKAGEARKDELYIIKSGSVEVLKIIEEKEVQLAILGPGDLIGEMSMILGRPSGVIVRAKEESLLTKIPKSKFTAVLETQPKWFQLMVSQLARRLAAMNNKFND